MKLKWQNISRNLADT